MSMTAGSLFRSDLKDRIEVIEIWHPLIPLPLLRIIFVWRPLWDDSEINI
jgi:hypothetical protein